MMLNIADLSIKNKLITIIMLISGIVLLIASTSYIVKDLMTVSILFNLL